MSIQRYDFAGYSAAFATKEGAFVSYADHVAAVTEGSKGIGLADYQAIAQRGAEAERARIRQAVEALPKVAAFVDELAIVRLPHVLSIIDGDTDA